MQSENNCPGWERGEPDRTLLVPPSSEFDSLSLSRYLSGTAVAAGCPVSDGFTPGKEADIVGARRTAAGEQTPVAIARLRKL